MIGCLVFNHPINKADTNASTSLRQTKMDETPAGRNLGDLYGERYSAPTLAFPIGGVIKSINKYWNVPQTSNYQKIP